MSHPARAEGLVNMIVFIFIVILVTFQLCLQPSSGVSYRTPEPTQNLELNLLSMEIDESSGSNILSDKDYQASSQKFRQVIICFQLTIYIIYKSRN